MSLFDLISNLEAQSNGLFLFDSNWKEVVEEDDDDDVVDEEDWNCLLRVN